MYFRSSFLLKCSHIISFFFSIQHVVVTGTVEEEELRLHVLLTVHQHFVMPSTVRRLTLVHILDPNWYLCK